MQGMDCACGACTTTFASGNSSAGCDCRHFWQAKPVLQLHARTSTRTTHKCNASAHLGCECLHLLLCFLQLSGQALVFCLKCIKLCKCGCAQQATNVAAAARGTQCNHLASKYRCAVLLTLLRCQAYWAPRID